MEQRNLAHLIPVAARTPPVATLGAPAQITIHDEINKATQRQHTTLNRLIIDRIPFGLPPATTDPTKYGQGIAAFAQIYFAFEQVWDDIIDANIQSTATDDSHEARVLSWLATLRPPGLVRTRRLERDLQHLSNRTGGDLHRNSKAYEQIHRRIQQTIRKRPHTLVAYAWVMYMALFSGGRWIRLLLNRAGPKFWDDHDVTQYDNEQKVPLDTAGFSFLSFDGGKDGTDIKAGFKSRLADGETLLSERERRDIVNASVTIFDDCIELIGILDNQTRGPRSRRRRIWQRVAIGTGVIGLAMGLLGIMIYFDWVSMGLGYPTVGWHRPVLENIREAWVRISQRRDRLA